MEEFHRYQPFPLENGQILPDIRIGYHTYGNLNAAGDNVVWICHALNCQFGCNPLVAGHGGGTPVCGSGKTFYCMCQYHRFLLWQFWSAQRKSGNGQKLLQQFPQITIRDMVKAHILLRKYLGIKQIKLLMGGSMGGYQALEWCLMEPAIIQDLFLIATSAAESAWGIAVHTSQRLSIEADATWMDQKEDAGAMGLRAARGIGILTYRNYAIMKEKQSDPDMNKLDNYRASSYISYQGNKLSRRFNAYSYWLLTKAMDSHNISRNRGGDLKKVLASITQRTLIVGITSDILCPLGGTGIPGSKYSKQQTGLHRFTLWS